jgi:hypothetical protein
MLLLRFHIVRYLLYVGLWIAKYNETAIIIPYGRYKKPYTYDKDEWIDWWIYFIQNKFNE